MRVHALQTLLGARPPQPLNPIAAPAPSVPPDVPGPDDRGLSAGAARLAAGRDVTSLRAAAQRHDRRQAAPRPGGRDPHPHHG